MCLKNTNTNAIGRVENIVGKGENVGNHNFLFFPFLFFPQYFQKTLSSRLVKERIVWWGFYQINQIIKPVHLKAKAIIQLSPLHVLGLIFFSSHLLLSTCKELKRNPCLVVKQGENACFPAMFFKTLLFQGCQNSVLFGNILTLSQMASFKLFKIERVCR